MARRATSTHRTRPAPVTIAPQTGVRRKRLLAVSIGLIVAVILLILAGVAGVSYYNDHRGVLATVNGQAITRDDYRARHAVEAWRLDYREAELRAAQSAGRLAPETAGIFLQFVANARSSLDVDTIERLIDARLQGQLAAQSSLPPVTDQQVDDALVAEASTPEQRHVWVIGYRPAVDLATGQTSAAEIAAARARAEQGLADVRSGATWQDIARASDDEYASTGGDAGFLSSATPQLDEAFMAAAFKLPVNGISGVIEGNDGEFRIGRVTEILPPSVDPAYQQKIRDAGVSLDAYREAVRSDVLASGLEAKVVADLIDQATPERRVSQIFIALGSGGRPEERMAAVQAQAGQPGADFAAIARQNSDRDASSGGDIGWVAKYQLDQFRAAAILDTPVGSVSRGFHLADGLYLFKITAEEVRKPEGAQIAALKVNGFPNWFAEQKQKASINRQYSTDTNGLPVMK